MPTVDPIAVRVARRHLSGVAAAAPITLSVGALTARGLRRVLESESGVIHWEGVTADDALLVGTLVVHVRVSDAAVETWVEIRIDGRFTPRISREVQRRRHGLETVEHEGDDPPVDDDYPQ